MKNLKLLLVIIAVITASCSKEVQFREEPPDPNNEIRIVTMIIAPTFYVSQDSQGNSQHQLSVVIKEFQIWTLLALDDIENFTYEEGYTYNLKVERTRITKPPTESVGNDYKLLEVLSKDRCKCKQSL